MDKLFWTLLGLSISAAGMGTLWQILLKKCNISGATLALVFAGIQFIVILIGYVVYNLFRVIFKHQAFLDMWKTETQYADWRFVLTAATLGGISLIAFARMNVMAPMKWHAGFLALVAIITMVLIACYEAYWIRKAMDPSLFLATALIIGAIVLFRLR